MNGVTPRFPFLTVLAETAAVVPGLLTVVLTLALLLIGSRDSSPLWPVHDLTLAEAAALRDGAMVVRLVRAGTNPNAPSHLRKGILGHADRDVLPMEAAVGAKRLEIVELLVASGAAIDLAQRERLTCLARIQGADDIVEFLRAEAPAGWTDPSCAGAHVPWE